MANSITIVDYGMGNLRSVAKAVEKVGGCATVTSDPRMIQQADRLILPGVGAFRDAMAKLTADGLVEPIKDFIGQQRPFLGICLGLQMLFERSHEDGEHIGLGILAGDVVRFQPPVDGPYGHLKVPHMGWNGLTVRRAAPLLANLPSEPFVYFVHSYYVRPSDPGIIAAEADYGGPFTAMIWKENIQATQFHPEKSQKQGLAMLGNFLNLA